MSTQSVTDASFKSEVLEADRPVVVDFWAEWCGPCRLIAPALEEISHALGDTAKVVKVNVDECPKVAGQLGIQSIPTLIIFKGGAAIARKVGAAPKASLQQWITDSIR